MPSFRDHWGSAQTAPESWHDHWASRSARMGVSSVALDPAGRPLAYALCAEWVDRELYVNIVGTVPSARGRGLARACLEHTIARASASGDYDTIELHVDSASPAGATRLYERVGFGLDKTFAAYERAAG
ncbi:MAG: GNAT family N-acetyltransferase [Ornithinimicrobium sp.]|uniref:GNAT family N-acetyltransferase n=1 Tax=Ornithinimicrobium sp. TaxID=1977084 RepID=UPI003D9B54B8